MLHGQLPWQEAANASSVAKKLQETEAGGRTDFWRSLPARSHSIRRLWLVRVLPRSTCRMMMQCERLEAVCRRRRTHSKCGQLCTPRSEWAAQPEHTCVHVDSSQYKTQHTCIHERCCCDTAFNGGPQDARQISSAAQLCHAQVLCEHVCTELCLLRSGSRMHSMKLFTFNAVASSSASCMPVWRSKPICRLSRYGFSRSLLDQRWTFSQLVAMLYIAACAFMLRKERNMPVLMQT
jgi:hypothetical protein